MESLLGAEDTVDGRALRAVAKALPAIGYSWTTRGVRSERGVVDRVTARSRAKEQAVAGIVSAELSQPKGQLNTEWSVRLVDAGAFVDVPFAGGRGNAPSCVRSHRLRCKPPP